MSRWGAPGRRVVGAVARLRRHGTRGSVEVGAAVVVASLFGGLLFGNGVARTVVDTVDGLTWLGDDRRGEVVQVNPATGRSENRLRVGQPGGDLAVAQRDGLLVVTDRRTGVVNVIDLATLLTNGRRQVTPGGSSKVLLDRARMYVADRDLGTITNVDPGSARTLGEPWQAAGKLADVAVDGASRVWALDENGKLFELSWSDDANRFVEQRQRPVKGAGAKGVLVAHERGVTVLGPEGGVVVQVDTGHDRAVGVPGLADSVRAADTSPTDLVPASVESTGTVIVIRGDEVLEVSVAQSGCERPGKPAVFHGLIYVPCLGARKVVVLDRDGHRARPDVVTPDGGDPELVLDDNRLLVNVPGADTGVVVENDGSTRIVSVRDGGGVSHDPGERPAAPPSTLPPTPTTPPPSQQPERQQQGDGGKPGNQAGGGLSQAPQQQEPPSSQQQPPAQSSAAAQQPTQPAQPGVVAPPPSPTARPPSPQELRPASVLAEERPDGSVLVTWVPGPARPTNYRVYFGPTQQRVAVVPGSATAASVTVLKPGAVGRFSVRAVLDPQAPAGTGLESPLSNQVNVYTWPGAPQNLQVVGNEADGASMSLLLRWEPPLTDNGRPVTGYQVTVHTDDGGAFSDLEVPPDVTTRGFRGYPLSIRCPSGVCVLSVFDIEVAAVNEGGPGVAAKLRWTHPLRDRLPTAPALGNRRAPVPGGTATPGGSQPQDPAAVATPATPATAPVGETRSSSVGLPVVALLSLTCLLAAARHRRRPRTGGPR